MSMKSFHDDYFELFPMSLLDYRDDEDARGCW